MTKAADIGPGDDPVAVSEALVGRTRTRLLAELFEFFELPQEAVDHIFGNLYTRDVLTQRERELCAVAALCVLNRTSELKSHVIAAIRCGASKREVAEVILQMSTYGGMPVCIDGLATAREVFDKQAGDRSG
ncbi:MAG: carboxymuconolactone decarboxylase family protein [Candidatus Binatia bacterium]